MTPLQWSWLWLAIALFWLACLAHCIRNGLSWCAMAMVIPPVAAFYPIVVIRLRESGRNAASSWPRMRQRAQAKVAELREGVDALERRVAGKV